MQTSDSLQLLQLPVELIVHIIRSFDDLCSLYKFASTCKFLHKIVKQDEDKIIKSFYATNVSNGSKSSNYMIQKKNCYIFSIKRTLPCSNRIDLEFSSLQSRYNAGYFCNIKKLSIAKLSTLNIPSIPVDILEYVSRSPNKNNCEKSNESKENNGDDYVVTVDIDVSGNLSLGSLQHASSSKLCLKYNAQPNQPINNNIYADFTYRRFSKDTDNSNDKINNECFNSIAAILNANIPLSTYCDGVLEPYVDIKKDMILLRCLATDLQVNTTSSIKGSLHFLLPFHFDLFSPLAEQRIDVAFSFGSGGYSSPYIFSYIHANSVQYLKKFKHGINE